MEKDAYIVYALIKEKKCIYVGCTSDIKKRINVHKKNKEFDNYIIICKSKIKNEALTSERAIIKYISIFDNGISLNKKYKEQEVKGRFING